MKDISEILLQRDTLYSDQTKVIFERIEPVLNGIREYFIFSDPSYTPAIFHWEEAIRFEADDMMMVIGKADYEIGASFILDGKMIEITEDNQQYFVRSLRIGLPFSIINQLNTDATFAFLHKLTSAAEEEAAQARAEEEEVMAILAKVEEEHEFDLDELSDDQRQALILSNVGKLN